MFPVAGNLKVRRADLFIKQAHLGREKGKLGILAEGVWDIVSKR